jgi:phage-related protein
MAVGELVVSIIGDMKELSNTFSQVQKEIGEVGKTFTSLGSSLSSTGSAMTTGITAPIVATGLAIGGVTKEAMGFQKEMTQVFTLMPNVSRSTMNSMENDIKSFSKEMGVTTTRVIPALYDAIGSGVPEDNVFNFLEVAHKGAVANVTDIGVAVDGLTSILNAYGYENITAAEASDILFTGINVGKMSYEELGQSLSSVVPTAASIGVKFGDITAALAAMTAQGTPTSEATTQLNRLLSELSKNGTVVSDSFKELTGKSFYKFIQEGGTLQGAIKILDEGFVSLDPNIKKIQEQMYQLADPTSNLGMEFEGVAGKSFKEFRKEGGTVEQALEMLGVKSESSIERVSELFGSIEAGNAILSLTGQGATIFNDALKEMENSAGATDRAYAMMSETASGSIDRIIARLQVAAVEMGEKFIPIVEDTIVLITDAFIPALEVAVDVIGVVADAFNKLPQPVKVVILAVTAFIAALGPVLVAVGAVVSSIGTLAAAFGTGGALAGAISFISATILPALSTAFGIIAYTVIPIVIEAIALLATPFGLVAAALVAFGLAWKNNWFDIQGKFQAAKTTIETAVRNFSNTLQQLWHGLIMAAGNLKTNLSTIWDTIKTVFSTVGNVIISAVQSMYAGLQSRYNSLIAAGQSLLASWRTHWTNFQTAISTAAGAISSYLGTLYSNIQSRFASIKTAASSILSAWKSHWSSFQSATSAAASALSSALSSMLSYVQSRFNQIKSAASSILSAWKSHWNNFKSATSSAASALNSALSSMLSYVTSKFNSIKSAAASILSAWKTHWNNFVSATKTAASNISSSLSSMLSNMQSRFNSIKSAVLNLLNDWKTRWNNIVSSTKTAGSQVVSAVKGIASDVKALVSSFSNAGKAIMDALYDSITSGFSKAIKKAKDSLKELKSYLPSSPAEKGPFSTLPNWDTVFVDPLSKSIAAAGKLATPLSNALSSLRSPIDSSLSAGFSRISNISNSSTTYAGDTISIGPNTITNGIDLQAIIAEIERQTANKRRARGLYK